MKYKIVTIRDRVADVYGVPSFVLSTGAAVRSFGDEINKKDGSPLSQHPEDFDLFYLGEYDDADGSFYADGPPRQLAVGKDLVK